jgi:L-fuconate dehydratase
MSSRSATSNPWSCRSGLDYVAVRGPLENRVLEYVDHLHEHFEDPVVMRGDRYMPPEAPGYSIEMKPESLARYEFPRGAAWAE